MLYQYTYSAEFTVGKPQPYSLREFGGVNASMFVVERGKSIPGRRRCAAVRTETLTLMDGDGPTAEARRDAAWVAAARAGDRDAFHALFQAYQRAVYAIAYRMLVNVVAPGVTETEMIAHLPKEQVLPLIPLQRLGTVDDIAAVVNFLCTEEHMYIHGQVIGVNGGLAI